MVDVSDSSAKTKPDREPSSEDRRAVALERALLASIVASSDDAIVSKGLNGIITSWNRGAERLFGYTADEVIGEPITIIIPPDRLGEEPEILGRIRNGERVSHYETTRRRKDGTLVDISLTVSPICDEAGAIIGASKIARDISARKAAEAALREADRRKDEFLAILAHELRNPLAPILTGVELMKRAGGDPAVVERARGIVERQTQHLVTLVDDLLDVSRITRGKFQLRRVRVALGDILAMAVEASRAAIDRGQHQLEVTQPDDAIHLDADPHRLAQVLANLLHNAAEFTPQPGRILLRAAREGGRAVVSVIDEGIGIPLERQAAIFEMFAQGERAHEHGHAGLGVGLTLARLLVELHGGDIGVRSEGRGSTFTVRLPALQDGAGVAEDRQAAAGVMPPCGARRVLVVDDNESAADMLAAVVEMLGHEVRTALDGARAIEVAASFRPEVIIMDLGMPTMSGYEAARRIRSEPWGAGIVMVALTGWGQEEHRIRTKEAGFDRHLVKPATAETLERLLAGDEALDRRPPPG